MNRQQIIKADLCARLPYGVKCEILDYQRDYVGNKIDTIVGIEQWSKDGKLWHVKTAGGAKPSPERVKPYLFSSLTEPITVAGYNDGKPFVPLFKALEEEFGEDEYEMTFLGSIWQVKDPSDNEEVLLESMGGDNYYQYFPNWFIEKLQKWHCNYRLLPGEFIPATNEYT